MQPDGSGRRDPPMEPVAAAASIRTEPPLTEQPRTEQPPTEPAVAAECGVDRIERELPAMLTPRRYEAGRWQPLRLVGEGVELTLLVRETGVVVGQSLQLPPVRFGNRLAELSLEGLPVVTLSAEEVERAVLWTSAVLGVLGTDDDVSFPLNGLLPQAAQMLAADGLRNSSPRDPLAKDEAAALLFLPSEQDLGVLDALRDPCQWAEAPVIADGTAAGAEEEWPIAPCGEPLVVLEHKRPKWIASTARGVKLIRGQHGLASIEPDRSDGQFDKSPKNLLQEATQRFRRANPTYTAERLGEQLWRATVTLDAATPAFAGDVASKKLASEFSAAQRALEWIAEHWGDEPPPPDRTASSSAAAAASASPPPSSSPPGAVAGANQLHGQVFQLANRLGGYATFRVRELGHQLYVAHVTLEGLDDRIIAVGPPSVREQMMRKEQQRAGTAEIVGEAGRSKKLAQRNVAAAALAEWGTWLGWDEDALAELGLGVGVGVGKEEAGPRSMAGADGGAAAAARDGGAPPPSARLVAPLRESQWRGASCVLVIARMLAAAVEVGALRGHLRRFVPREAIPSFAQLRCATTPRQIGGENVARERARWVGNAAIGLCSKVAAVLDLGQSPREAHTVHSRRYYLWVSNKHLASVVRANGWGPALFLQPWPGTSGITTTEASPETLAECFEAVVGEIFLTCVAEHGVDKALETVWSLFHTLVVHAPEHKGLRGDDSEPIQSWGDALSVLRDRLRSPRPGPDRAWAERLGIDRRPAEPRLIAAAAMREFEGQSLEFIGDGCLRVLQTLHIVEMIPDVEQGRRATVRATMERNAFLARRLVRLTGDHSKGLSVKLMDERREVLRSMAPPPSGLPRRSAAPGRDPHAAFFHPSTGDDFRSDLCVEEGGKSILADVLEALVGAIVLQDEQGFEGARRTFAHVVLPPAAVLTELASGRLGDPLAQHQNRPPVRSRGS